MLAIIITILSIVLDQLSKYHVVQNIELHETAPFIPKVLSLYHTQNRGAAFSMLSDKQWVFMVISTVSMFIIVWLLYKEYRRHTLLNVALSMVLGGGIGNMIDRVSLGYVVDFLHVDFVDFAVFNIADSFITVGAVLLIVYVIFFDSKVEARIKAEKVAQAASEPEATVENTEASVEQAEEAKENNNTEDTVNE